MRNAKSWVCGLVMGMTLAGAALLVGSPAISVGKVPEEVKSHWHHHDGHWSYWSAEDNQWYYTDGTNWFYTTGEGGWLPYRFDKKFGREGFEKGDYKVPGPEAKVAIPKHEVYRPRK